MLFPLSSFVKTSFTWISVSSQHGQAMTTSPPGHHGRCLVRALGGQGGRLDGGDALQELQLAQRPRVAPEGAGRLQVVRDQKDALPAKPPTKTIFTEQISLFFSWLFWWSYISHGKFNKKTCCMLFVFFTPQGWLGIVEYPIELWVKRSNSTIPR